MAELYVKVDTADIEELEIVKGLRYGMEALNYELQKAYETIEAMNLEMKALDREILSLQEVIQMLEHEKDHIKEHGNAKLNVSQVEMVRLMLGNGRSISDISKVMGVAPRTIRHIKNGTTWRNV